VIAPHPAKARQRHRLRYILAILAVLLCELLVFNMPHLLSMRYLDNHPSSQVSTVIGSGLSKDEHGLLTVTEPTKAYIELQHVNTKVGYVKVNFTKQIPQSQNSESQEVTTSVRVRLDTLSTQDDNQTSWHASRVITVRNTVPASNYLRSAESKTSADKLRLWIQEPTGTTITISGFNVNPRIPWHVDVMRIAILALIALIVTAFLPHSWLWRTKFDIAQRKQQLLLCGLLAPLAILTAYIIVHVIVWPGQQIFHNPNGYTYDFNQYGYVADALLHGRPWLNLKVPDQLLLSRNPLNVETRQQLLDQGTQPIYWDYVLFEGRWYSYFGVLPAVVLFLPYQAITSLWVPGGLMLPSEAASALLLFIACVMMILLCARIIHRHFSSIPVAVMVLSSLICITASNMVYLWHKGNFYTVPFAASLALSALGLWLWLGARRVNTSTGTRIWRYSDIQGTLRGNIVTTLSLRRMALGSLCLGANIACRPPFVLLCLLAIPIFWDEFVALLPIRHSRHRYAGIVEAPNHFISMLKFAISAVLPATLAVLGALAYNYWRFASFLNFGNLNQVTVVNLQEYQTPLDNIPYVLGYYFAQPLSLSAQFPWVNYAPAPLPRWQYTESGIGGLLILCPALILVVLLPALRRLLRSRRIYSLAWSLPILGFIIATFDTIVGGFVWRYMADFGLLLALGAMIVLCAIAERRGLPDFKDPHMSAATQLDAHNNLANSTRGIILGMITALVLLGALISLLAGVAIDMRANPDAYANMQSWFSLLQ
jgi:hypothetical protein